MEIENKSVTSVSNDIIIPIVLDASYKGDSLTKRVAEIIGTKDITSWSVIDTFENLALVHYNDNIDVDMSRFGYMRGLLVDTEKGTIVAGSFGYTPTAIANEITEKDGIIEIADTEGKYHKFNIDNINIKPVFEGVVIRVIWYNNKLYRFTHKKINPTKSRWGSSKNFLQIYEDAGGPTAEQLFDTTKPYSDTCYHFLVVDPTLLVATRQQVLAPYIVFIEKQTVDLMRPEDEIAPGIANFTMTTKMGGTVSKSVIHNPQQLSLELANHYLKYGYYGKFDIDDARQLTGEAVIIYSKEGDEITDVVKINSKSYEWRSNLRGGNSNVVNQFYALLGTVYIDINNDKAWNNFVNKLVFFPSFDIDEMKDVFNKNKRILILPLGKDGSLNPDKEEDKKKYNDRNSRIHLLWINYVLSLPANLQADALNILDNFKLDRKNLTNWIGTLEYNNKDIDKTEYSKHIKRIISVSRKLAREKVSNGQNYNAKGTQLSLNSLIKKTISNLIQKENGPSLYKMVKEMKKPPQPKNDLDVKVSEIKIDVFSDHENDEICENK